MAGTDRTSEQAATDDAPSELLVEFCGEWWARTIVEPLEFGRDAMLTVDEDNRYLHRVAGRFEHADGGWTLHNVGARVRLNVTAEGGRFRAELPPGDQLRLPTGPFSVRFEAGPATYELRGRCPTDANGGPQGRAGAAPPGDRTLPWGAVELNADQRMLLAALAEDRLRDPLGPTSALPANRQVAHRLGWTITKFNRKLDHLCSRLARQGVRGVQGDLGVHAADRRRHLVDHAISYGLVDHDDLGALDAVGGGGRSRSDR